MADEKECEHCHRKSNNGEKAMLWKFIVLTAGLCLGALTFVASGINDDITGLDTTLQKEISDSERTFQAKIDSLQKQIDENLNAQTDDHNAMHGLLERNDGWIRDHIETHP